MSLADSPICCNEVEKRTARKCRGKPACLPNLPITLTPNSFSFLLNEKEFGEGSFTSINPRLTPWATIMSPLWRLWNPNGGNNPLTDPPICFITHQYLSESFGGGIFYIHQPKAYHLGLQ